MDLEISMAGLDGGALMTPWQPSSLSFPHTAGHSVVQESFVSRHMLCVCPACCSTGSRAADLTLQQVQRELLG
jgi:hypothetical protein